MCFDRYLPSRYPWRQLPLLLAIAATPLVSGYEPAWWEQRGVFSKDTSGTRLTASDYAVINQGQLKNIVGAAVAELNAGLPGGAGPVLNGLIATWSAPDTTGTRQDYAAANIGQVKALATLIYDRLLAFGVVENYPWSGPGTTTSDYSLANIGQVKALFAFSVVLPVDSDSDGLPDWWEIKHFGNLGQVSSADFDFDGLSNAQELALGINPTALDSDADGLPDSWEVAIGLKPNSATGVDGGLGDLDGDGFSNIREYYSETNANGVNQRPVGMVGARHNHSLALTADGRVWSWGTNSSGELGDGTTVFRNAPVPLAIAPGMAKVIWVDTGRSFSLALDENGVLWGWGSNSAHQISKDATYQFETPVRIDLPAPVARFACGGDHVLAVDRGGRLWSWGSNSNSQLGMGHADVVGLAGEIPKPSAMSGIVSLAASGIASYAVDVTGRMWSWGNNGDGQLGDGSNTIRNAPVAVDTSNGVPAIKSIVSDDWHAMASAVDGSIWTWGYNGVGQLGIGNTTSKNKPVKVTTGLVSASSLGTGENHSLAVSSGSVWGWGFNQYGQLGTNSTTPSSVAVATASVANLSNMIQASGGANHSIALKSDGRIWSWGYNYQGQLGLGDGADRLIPTPISNLKLADDDSEPDGLPDSWEKYYYAGSLTHAGSATGIAGGVTNLVAFSRGLNPLKIDNDNDGISDVDEIAAGLDPLDWSDATGDIDGDRVPNLWEIAMGSSMTNAGSVPVTNVSTVAVGQSIQTTISALAGNSSNPPWYVIKVSPGVYNENITLPANKRISLIPASVSGIPEIRGINSSATIGIYGGSVIDGFRITHATGVDGPGVDVNVSSGGSPARVVNCMVHDHAGFYGSGLFVTRGRLVVACSSIFRSSTTSHGNGLYVYSNEGRVQVINSIFWNPKGKAPEEVHSFGITESRQTIARDGSIQSALTANPLLDPLGFLDSSSPARGKGTSQAGALRDIHGEARGSSPDIGADHYHDSDGDSIPDWWEQKYGLANGVDNRLTDFDGDLLLDAVEYSYRTDPVSVDTDSDQISDYLEIYQTYSNPLVFSDIAFIDSDGDGLTNLYEVNHGTRLDLFDSNGDNIGDGVIISVGGHTPSSQDPDGDGLSTEQEWILGTSPVAADSDGDGVTDGADPDPLDPTIGLPSQQVGDVTAPLISLKVPTNAVEN